MRGNSRRLPVLRAGRLVRIRRAIESDQAELARLRADPDIDHFMGIDASPSAWLWRHVPLGDQSAALTDLMITTLVGDPLGLVSLWDRAIPHNAAELSIWIGAGHRDRGYGSEALRLTLRYAFDDLHLHKVYLRVLEFNHRARRTYEKCGFVVEGVLREEMCIESVWHSLLYMGVLASDFQDADLAFEPIDEFDSRMPPAVV